MSDTEADNPMEELAKAHRKEKKELQVKSINLRKQLANFSTLGKDPVSEENCDKRW